MLLNFSKDNIININDILYNKLSVYNRNIVDGKIKKIDIKPEKKILYNNYIFNNIIKDTKKVDNEMLYLLYRFIILVKISKKQKKEIPVFVDNVNDPPSNQEIQFFKQMFKDGKLSNLALRDDLLTLSDIEISEIMMDGKLKMIEDSKNWSKPTQILFLIGTGLIKEDSINEQKGGASLTDLKDLFYQGVKKSIIFSVKTSIKTSFKIGSSFLFHSVTQIPQDILQFINGIKNANNAYDSNKPDDYTTNIGNVIAKLAFSRTAFVFNLMAGYSLVNIFLFGGWLPGIMNIPAIIGGFLQGFIASGSILGSTISIIGGVLSFGIVPIISVSSLIFIAYTYWDKIKDILKEILDNRDMILFCYALFRAILLACSVLTSGGILYILGESLFYKYILDYMKEYFFPDPTLAQKFMASVTYITDIINPFKKASKPKSSSNEESSKPSQTGRGIIPETVPEETIKCLAAKVAEEFYKSLSTKEISTNLNPVLLS